jgi:hypothetical protein
MCNREQKYIRGFGEEIGRKESYMGRKPYKYVMCG